MGIFQQFPYSNFHEMNLDQIIKIMRQMQDEWAATKTEWASYKDFIDNYFANLDVSEEVLEALRAMAASGELNTIIDPTIASAVSAWLAEHITPTTPVIDKSLSIEDAGADAKVTGNMLKALWTPNAIKRTITFTQPNQEIDTDIVLLPGCTYYIKTTSDIGGSSNLKVWVKDYYADANKDLIKNNFNDLTPTATGLLRIWNRNTNSYIGSVDIEIMSKFAFDAHKTSGFLTSTSQFASLDDITTNSVYQVTAGYSSGDASNLTHTNTPIEFRGTGYNLITVATQDASGDYRFQIAINPFTGICYTRKTSAGAFSTWRKQSVDAMGFIQSVSKYASLDDITDNGFWLVSSSYAAGDPSESTATNTPRELIGKAWELLSVNASETGDYRFQMAISPETSEIFLRKTVYGVWDSWHNVMANTSIEWQLDFSNYSDTWTDEWETQESSKGRPNLLLTNKGIDLKVVSYNVAGYRYDGESAYIVTEPEKLLNLKKFVANADSDIMIVQEEKGFIDEDEEYSASKALYYDRLPFNAKYYGTNIRAKYQAYAHGQVEVPKLANSDVPISGTMSNRYFTWAMLNIENKNVLVISCHPMNSNIRFSTNPVVGPTANRLNFLQIIYDFVFCMHDENIISGLNADVTAPWDYVVIGGDFNTTNINGRDADGTNYNGDDWGNFAELRDYYKFDSANGGYLNWFITYPFYTGDNYGALDNILVSDNIIINNIDCK